MRVLAAGLGLTAIVVVAVGWLQSPGHITAAEAVAAAESAYAAAGLRGAVVDPHPDAGDYVAETGDVPLAVWETVATVDGGTVELWLLRADGESVFLDDRAPDGSSLLSASQFQQLADHYENPAVGRQVRRNLILTVAAALVALLGVRLSLVRRRRAVPSAPSLPARPPRGSPLRATPLQSSPPPDVRRTTPLQATPRRASPIRARQETL